ncbi:MAG: DUF1684 domain-containing protein [Gammaproteobacteria bacterium]|nr:MAG: DUF1684 domain-containing protein [Gammaproteobacteria bacterium]
MSRFQFLHWQPAIRAGLVVLTAICWLAAAESATHGIGDCPNDYRHCLEAWKARRIASLKGETGYLNLAGLFWLRSGVNTFGSGAGNDLKFPAAAMPEMGTFELGENGVVMNLHSGVDVRMDGSPVSRVQMADDTSENPGVVTFDSLTWSIIRRDDRFAVRLRDLEHPVLRTFPPIDYFPTDQNLRVEARLQRYERPRIVRVDTVIEGLDYNPTSPGLLRFEIGGQSFELEAYNAGDEFLLVFGDATTGRETYPAGRFLYASNPDEDGVVVLDFNTAQNPPCAYNDFATCPVASPRNRLAVRIPAGERFDPSGH